MFGSCAMSIGKYVVKEVTQKDCKVESGKAI